MRQIGSISTLNLAEMFADFLRAAGTACTVEKGGDGYVVWVHDDDRVAAAKEELPRFLADPENQRYIDARQQARARLRSDLDRQKAARKRTVNLSDRWNRPMAESCPLTFGLIAISMLIGFLTGLHPVHDDPRVVVLWFSNDGTLKPILKGEVWRLITPIFIHMDWMHLLFNMLGLQQFGMQIEYRKGTPKYLGMVLVIAALSNFAQFVATGQYFGGMSGVVYGLFGYLWVKSRLEPDSGFSMAQQTVTVMIGWHILCMMGWVGQIANWAHGIGLVTGVALGMSASLLKPFRRTD